MAKTYLRIYQEFVLEEVNKHLLIVGDLSSDCGACRALGLDALTVKHCPQCGTEFKFITSRRIENHPGERFQIVKRYRERRPELPFIDYGDFSKSLGQKKAREFFG